MFKFDQKIVKSLMNVKSNVIVIYAKNLKYYFYHSYQGWEENSQDSDVFC